MKVGYVDSDWVGDEIKRRKKTGNVFKMFTNCSITSNTKKNYVATSSTAAEYMALFEAVKEAIWLEALSKSVNSDLKNEIVIYEDKNGCISIAKNPMNNKLTRHIYIKYHYSRERVKW